jgi:hypothetical protein
MKNKEVYQQNICNNCLQMLVNGESDHTEEELSTMNKTLDNWAKDKYIPAGLSDNLEPSFSWHKCDLCDGLAGDRYEFNFFDESNE